MSSYCAQNVNLESLNYFYLAQNVTSQSISTFVPIKENNCTMTMPPDEGMAMPLSGKQA